MFVEIHTTKNNILMFENVSILNINLNDKTISGTHTKNVNGSISFFNDIPYLSYNVKACGSEITTKK